MARKRCTADQIVGKLREAETLLAQGRVRRIWRQEWRNVPWEQPKRGRLRLTEGCCLRRGLPHRNHDWSYDFLADRTHDGLPSNMLTVIDQYGRRLNRRLANPTVHNRMAFPACAFGRATNGPPGRLFPTTWWWMCDNRGQGLIQVTLTGRRATSRE